MRNPKTQSINSNLGEWLRFAEARLTHNSGEHISSLHAIICANLRIDKPAILAHPERELSNAEIERLEKALHRLLDGEPLAYIINNQSFYGLDLFIDQSVLIPRPETESLVSEALKWLSNNKAPLQALDIGTGSACIPISICANNQNVMFDASDLSFPALNIAMKNVSNYNLQNRIYLYQSDLTKCFRSQYKLICANLPYIPTNRLATLEVAKFEPFIALDGGLNGERIIKQFLFESTSLLGVPGLLVCEIDYTQFESLLSVSQQLFQNAHITIIKDFSGLPRVLRIEKHQ